MQTLLGCNGRLLRRVVNLLLYMGALSGCESLGPEGYCDADCSPRAVCGIPSYQMLDASHACRNASDPSARAQFTLYVNVDSFSTYDAALADIMPHLQAAADKWNNIDADIELVLAETSTHLFDLGRSGDNSSPFFWDYCGDTDGVSSVSLLRGDPRFGAEGAVAMAAYTKCSTEQSCLISEIDIAITDRTFDYASGVGIWLDWSLQNIPVTYNPATGSTSAYIGFTVQHEFGHVLGLADDYGSGSDYANVSIMTMKLGSQTSVVDLPAVDCRAVWWLYGGNPISGSVYPPAACIEVGSDWECPK